MNHFVLSLLGAACFFSVSVSTQAAILAQWTFEGSTPRSIEVVPEGGIFAATSAASRTAGAQSTGSGNGSSTAWRGNNWDVGDYFEFQTSTAGYSDVNVSWAQVAYPDAPRDFALSYSTDGSTFTQFAIYEVSAGTFHPSSFKPDLVHLFDLSAITTLNDQPTVYFRLTNTSTVAVGGGTVASNGSIRLDDFMVMGVIPEPAMGAIVLVGAGLLIGGSRGRRAAA